MYGVSFSWLCALWVVGRWRSSGSLVCDFLAEELRKLCHPHWRCPLPSTGKETYRTSKTINELPNAPQSQSLYTVLYHPLNNPPVRVVNCNVICSQNSGFEFACLHLLLGGRPCHVVQRTEINDENYTKYLDSSKLTAGSGCVHAMNTYGGMEVYFHLFILALGGCAWSYSWPGRFILPG